MKAMRGLGSLLYLFKLVPIYLGLLVFYIYGRLWTLKPRKAESMKEVLDLFYYDFLFLRPKHVSVLKLDEDELITISRNPCPILRLSMLLGLDTRFTCKVISETVCVYVLRRLNANLQFERDYRHIRPYKDGCLERIKRKARKGTAK
ncbi:MAG: hypothetical protein QXK88_03815 [Desulfurococcaceae archaeon]